MTDKMFVGYECKMCSVKNAGVNVRFRWSSEDVVKWMEEIAIPAVAKHHRRRSPWCRAKTVDLMIPVPEGTTFVGGRVLN